MGRGSSPKIKYYMNKYHQIDWHCIKTRPEAYSWHQALKLTLWKINPIALQPSLTPSGEVFNLVFFIKTSDIEP